MNDAYHKLMYDRVRKDHPQLPVWDDLNNAQKARMREANDEYANFMNEIGMEIRGKIPGQEPLEP